MAKLTIYRGLPGSGKTTRARETDSFILSPSDMYSMENGEYKWTAAKHIRGHNWAMDIFNKCLTYRIDIVIAEVLPRISDVMEFVVPAKQNDYNIEVIDCEITREESVKRNVHEVDPDNIDEMMKSWEPWSNH